MRLAKTMLVWVSVWATLAGCAYSVHQNQIGDFSPYAARGQGKIVVSEVSRQVVLADFSRMELVNEAYAKLLAECPGVLTGISTQHSTDLGFFSWKNKIRLEGLCLG